VLQGDCSALQCIAVRCSVLQCVAVCYNVLQCIAVCCSVLQSVAVRCSVLQRVAVCCSVLPYARQQHHGSKKLREASEQAMQRRPHVWRWGKMTVIPMRASCPSVACSAPMKSCCRGRRGRRPPFASATSAESPKNRYTVSASICVANVTTRPHSARRRFVLISLSQDRRNFASIFTPSKG